ncbi:hypothetical protein [Desulfovibrio litoralis]|uniref:Uncharacterized protein n=1 Tax=Desulfovibrio litoralis DSM 11393 TaxID=1121455 RepID=A0A1M7TK15_9BACT|nr:hypothetical protein [Desulfovibrio litoralis]SHN70968.1 hypothetical protein SAMN02745728_02117 [Desulfovibrio litoralis DSM 11393]
MNINSIELSFDSLFSNFSSAQQSQSAGFSKQRRFSKINDISTTAADYLSNKSIESKYNVKLNELSAEDLEAYKKQSAELKDALAKTINFVGKNFGEEVATVVTAMLYKNTSESLNEENLGQGLLEATTFIDKNLGTDSGDKFLAYLNQNINNAMNNFFENGKNEVFIAINTSSNNYTVPGLSKVGEEANKTTISNFDALIQSVKLSVDNLRANKFNSEQLHLIKKYDNTGTASLITPESGFLLETAV